jgi:hypothetical protein
MTREDIEHDVHLDVEARVRESVKAEYSPLLKKVFQEEMTEHFQASGAFRRGR